jgi:hypothetical protein
LSENLDEDHVRSGIDYGLSFTPDADAHRYVCC